MKYYKTFWFSLLLALITVVLVYIIYGLYLENTENMMAALFQGNIPFPPYNAWFLETWLFQLPVIVFLSAQFQQIPVYGIWHLIIIILRLWIWFHLAIRIFGRITKAWPFFQVLSAYLFVLIITGTSLVSIYYLRDAILLAAGSLFLFLDYHIYENRRPAPFLILFLLASLIRVSGIILVLIPTTILMGFYFKSFKEVFASLKFPWLLAMMCLLVVETHKLVDGNPGSKIEARLEYAICDRDAKVPLSEMKTALDSARYEALTDFFLVVDSAQINVDFITRLVDKEKWMNLGITRDDVNHFFKNSLPAIQKYKGLLYLFYLLLILALFYSPQKTILQIIIFNAFCWVIVLIIGLKLTVYEYFLAPWLSVVLGGSLWVFSLRTAPIKTRQKIPIYILLVIMIWMTNRSLKDIVSSNLIYNQTASSYLQNIEALSRTSKPVLWTSEDSFFPNDLFTRSETKMLQKCIYLNLYYGFFYPWSQVQCQKEFGCSPVDWKCMGLAFIKNREQISFVMSDRFAEFVPRYYKNVYSIQFKLVKNIPEQEIIPGNYVFHLEAE